MLSGVSNGHIQRSGLTIEALSDALPAFTHATAPKPFAVAAAAPVRHWRDKPDCADERYFFLSPHVIINSLLLVIDSGEVGFTRATGLGPRAYSIVRAKAKVKSALSGKVWHPFNLMRGEENAPMCIVMAPRKAALTDTIYSTVISGPRQASYPSVRHRWISAISFNAFRWTRELVRGGELRACAIELDAGHLSAVGKYVSSIKVMALYNWRGIQSAWILPERRELLPTAAKSSVNARAGLPELSH